MFVLIGSGVGALVGAGIALKKWWDAGGNPGKLWAPFAGYLVISSACSGAAVGLLGDFLIFHGEKINVKTGRIR